MQQLFSCPNCGSSNDIGNQFCIVCGQNLQYSCPKCNTIVKPSFSTCPRCHSSLYWPGQNVAQSTQVHARETTGKSKIDYTYSETRKQVKGSRTPLLIILLVIILVAGGIVYFLENQSKAITPGAPNSPTSVAPTVTEPPNIEKFEVNPIEIIATQAATLQWKVNNANVVKIDQEIGDVPISGTKSISPATSTTYKLTATNSAGSVNRTVTIKVIENTHAAQMALIEEDVKPYGYSATFNSEPTVAGSISTYSIKFVKGDSTLENTVVILSTIESAEKRYSDFKVNVKDYVTKNVAVGDRGYLLTVPSSSPDKSASYSIRFQKNNVYVTIGGNVVYKDLETLAKLVESRIH